MVDDEQLTVLRVLADRRRALGAEHTYKINQLHALLLELIAGGAKRFPSAAQACRLLATVRLKTTSGKVTKRVALELVRTREQPSQRVVHDTANYRLTGSDGSIISAHENATVTMNANGVFTVSFDHDFMTCP